jgi:hypothetical protein
MKGKERWRKRLPPISEASGLRISNIPFNWTTFEPGCATYVNLAGVQNVKRVCFHGSGKLAIRMSTEISSTERE